MKAIPLLLGISLLAASVHSSEPIVVSKLPEFKTASEWAADINKHRPSFTLLHVLEKKEVWLAFFRTKENNLVLSEKYLTHPGNTSGTRSITDSMGKSLVLSDYDASRDREVPTQGGRSYTTDFKIVHENGWDIYSRDDGLLIALKQPVPQAFRFRKIVKPHDGRKPIVVDEVIDFKIP